MKLHKIYSLLSLFILFPCYAMESESALLIREKIIPNPLPKGCFATERIDGITYLADDTYYSAIAHNPCKPELALGLSTKIMLWNLKKNKRMHLLKLPEGHKPESDRLVYNPTGTQLASASNFGDHRIHLWNLATKKIVQSFCFFKHDDIYGLVFGPGGNELIIESFKKFIIVDIANRMSRSILIEGVPGNTIHNPNGKGLAYSTGYEFNLWNWGSQPKEIQTSPRLPFTVTGRNYAFNHDGTQIIATSEDLNSKKDDRQQDIVLWNLKSESPSTLTLDKKVTLDKNKEVQEIAYCPRINKYLAVISSNKNIYSIITINPDDLTVAEEMPLHPLKPRECVVASEFKFSDDGSKLTHKITIGAPFEGTYIRYYEVNSNS